ncbi:MAG: hypothetical protein IJF02_05125 [Oscillospiraceae bacterium]|nr:hypothetical protein [Oscillospiraceae bacterium]MBQ6852375.1 hypothetical protein [Oscillospiraceae bacterium]
MADLTFNTKENQTVDRHLLLLYLNTGTDNGNPVWSPVGKRVGDSSMNYDWSEETTTDILGDTHTSMSKPVITQSFDPMELTAGDKAQLKIWNAAIRDQDPNALANMDMLVVHLYAGTADTAAFAERYTSCAVKPSSLGGAGGGKLGMPIDVTYGGTRTIGTATVKAGAVTFTPEA